MSSFLMQIESKGVHPGSRLTPPEIDKLSRLLVAKNLASLMSPIQAKATIGELILPP